MVEQGFIIIDKTGIHARPATQLVNAASQFGSEITLGYKGKSVNLKSIMGVLSLGIAKDDHITIQAEGSDEIEALNKVADVIKGGLGK